MVVIPRARSRPLPALGDFYEYSRERGRMAHTMLSNARQFPTAIHKARPRDVLAASHWDHAKIADVKNAIDCYEWML